MLDSVFVVISMVLFEFERRSVGWLLYLQELSVRTIELVALITLQECCELMGDGTLMRCLLSEVDDYST